MSAALRIATDFKTRLMGKGFNSFLNIFLTADCAFSFPSKSAPLMSHKQITLKGSNGEDLQQFSQNFILRYDLS